MEHVTSRNLILVFTTHKSKKTEKFQRLALMEHVTSKSRVGAL